jgi:DNA repair photolyase
MEYKNINYDNVITKITKKDKLFLGEYIIDPYQNCQFSCKYCDSSNDEIIYVKNDFLNKVKNEIINLSKGTIIIGSVIDPYQLIEKEYEYTRNLLKIIKENDFSAHILTKSDLVLRDLDILSNFKDLTITISISMINKNISEFFEKNVPSTIDRLKLIKKLSDNEIKSGLAVIPVLPYFIEDGIENIFKYAIKYKSEYLLYKHLELKGFQKDVFYNYLKIFNINILEKYVELFKDNYYPDKSYTDNFNNLFLNLCEKYRISNSIQ